MTETTPNTTKICPTCGTRLNINATRCSVCGANFAPATAVSADKAVRGARIPEVTLSLPIVIGLAILLLLVGSGGVYAYFQANAPQVQGISADQSSTPTATVTTTPTITFTPTDEVTETPAPTWTPLAPIDYKVAPNDTCLSIAYVYNVSVNAIIQLNKLSSECLLSTGMDLKIPQPTPTPSPQPTNTLNPTEIAQQDCQKVEYLVKSGDTLGGIAANYAVKPAAILQYSGKVDEIVRVGEKLVIPLCEQSLEAPTATPIPPYPAPALLLPADGTSLSPTM